MRLTDETDWWDWLMGLTDGTDWWDWLMRLTDGTDWWDWLMGLTDGTDWWDWLMGLTDGTDWWDWLMGLTGGTDCFVSDLFHADITYQTMAMLVCSHIIWCRIIRYYHYRYIDIKFRIMADEHTYLSIHIPLPTPDTSHYNSPSYIPHLLINMYLRFRAIQTWYKDLMFLLLKRNIDNTLTKWCGTFVYRDGYISKLYFD